uniref:Ground-like domain-containing protein n=1 Tax=Plectus sambesii TaxID=2011161 RepID=A0A914VFG4_9BILA
MKSIAFVAGVLLVIGTVDGFGFGLFGGGGGGGGCGGGCGAPPPPPPCPPPPPPPSCGCGGGGGGLSMPSFPNLFGGLGGGGGCGGGCGGRKRRDATSAISGDASSTLCTSEKLRQVLHENISGSTAESKTAIQKATLTKLKGTYDVVCGKGDFSFVVNSKDFCQETVNEVTCYAFRQL